MVKDYNNFYQKENVDFSLFQLDFISMVSL